MFSYEGQNYTGVEFDARNIRPGNLFVPVIGKRDGHHFIPQAIENGAKGSLYTGSTPDVPEGFSLHKVSETIEGFQNAAKGHRMAFNGKVIAITGSNGKTTVKEMLAGILSQRYLVEKSTGNFNNHLGVPYTLLNASLEADIWIVEVGTNHPGEIETLKNVCLPDLAIITNVGDAHIGNFGSRKNIALEKFSLAKGLAKEQVFTNSNCMYSLMAPSITTASYEISNQNKEQTEFRYRGEAYEIPLFGNYNVENALLAIEVAHSFGFNAEEIKRGLKNFAMQAYRQKWIDYGKMEICLDCYNASPSSLIRAAEEFDQVVTGPKIFILGDLYELGPEEKEIHQKIGRDLNGKNVWFVGPLMKEAYVASENETKRYFHTKEEVKEVLSYLKEEKISVFIKASRGMGLEKIVEEGNLL